MRAFAVVLAGCATAASTDRDTAAPGLCSRTQCVPTTVAAVTLGCESSPAGDDTLVVRVETDGWTGNGSAVHLWSPSGSGAPLGAGEVHDLCTVAVEVDGERRWEVLEARLSVGPRASSLQCFSGRAGVTAIDCGAVAAGRVTAAVQVTDPNGNESQCAGVGPGAPEVEAALEAGAAQGSPARCPPWP